MGQGEGGSREPSSLWSPPPLPSVPSRGDGTVQSRGTDYPRNLQSWSQCGAVVLGRPRASRHANKITASLASPRALGESCCFAPWRPLSTASQADPTGEESQGALWARGMWRRQPRMQMQTLGRVPRPREKPSPWSALSHRHHFPLDTFSRSPFHHGLPYPAARSFCFSERKQNPVNPQILT